MRFFIYNSKGEYVGDTDVPDETSVAEKAEMQRKGFKFKTDLPVLSVHSDEYPDGVPYYGGPRCA